MANVTNEEPKSSLEVYEQDAGNKPPYFLTLAEIKLLSITGVSIVPLQKNPLIIFFVQVGFFVDGLSITFP